MILNYYILVLLAKVVIVGKSQQTLEKAGIYFGNSAPLIPSIYCQGHNLSYIHILHLYAKGALLWPRTRGQIAFLLTISTTQNK